MRIRKYAIIAFICVQPVLLHAKDYPASLFGIRSDGSTLYTRSIQFAIDYINREGGGRLVFDVGRYLTGSIHLKSNVTLHLQEGAVLVGSTNPFDYDKKLVTALIFAYDQHDIAITGKGIIDGQGRALATNVTENIHKGLLKDLFRNDRPEADNRAMIINFRNSRNILLRGVTIRNAASWVQTYDQCTNLRMDSLFVDSRAFWNNDGVDIVDCDSVALTNSYIDAADDGVCLKSHDAAKFCNNILVRNCIIRSSASGIKFGTASYGGFRNIRLINNKVFDTYRSAIALEAVDGGFLENVTVDSLQSLNTWNAVFLRIGERVAGRKGRLENIQIRNVYAEVPAAKPDAGYEYEGPIEDMPRNLTPAIVIAGMPDVPVNNVLLENIVVRFAGGGNPMFAKVTPDAADKVPEKANAYPDFSMFGELPAWGAYIRHARKVEFRNVSLDCAKRDYRVAIVLDDVHQSQFISTTIKEAGQAAAPAGQRKKDFYMARSSEIIKK